MTHLYRHFNAGGELLYVGISLSAVHRLGQHKEHSHWFSTISRVEIQKFETREEALLAETHAIRDEKPKHNIKKRSAEKTKNEKTEYVTAYAENARNELVGMVVNFNLLYTYQEVAKILRIGTATVKLLVQEKKLGTVILPPTKEGMSHHGTPYKEKEFVSGWQLISYFEKLHKGVF